jgi:vacuolar-type H+-ATPase subunit I/STV1
MFGDVGHGLFLLLAVSFMLIKEKKLLNSDLPEMLAFPFGGRYLLLVMSLFVDLNYKSEDYISNFFV